MKTVLTVSFLLLFFSTALTQDCDSLNKNIRNLLITGNYKDAFILSQNNMRLLNLSDSNYACNAISLNNLANAYFYIGKYDSSIVFNLAAISIYDFNFGKDSLYANFLNDIGCALFKKGSVDSAFEYLNESITIFKALYPKCIRDLSNSYDNIASIYSEKGNFSLTKLYLDSAQTLRKEFIGKFSDEYANGLNNLADFYYQNNDFDKALVLIDSAINIKEHIFGKVHPDFITLFSNKSIYLIEIGQSAEAQKFQQKALELVNNIFEKNSVNAVPLLKNIATGFSRSRNYDSALTYLNYAHKLCKKNLKPHSKLFQDVVLDIGRLQNEIGNYEIAISIFDSLICQKKINNDTTTISYCSLLSNLAFSYWRIKKFDSSLFYYLQTESKLKILMGKSNLLYSKVISNIAMNYYFLRNDSSFTLYSDSAFKIKNTCIENISCSLTSKQIQSFYKLSSNDNYVRLSFQLNKKSNDLNLKILTAEFNAKGLALGQLRLYLRKARNDTSFEIRELLNNLTSLRNYVSRQYTLPLSKQVPDLKDKEAEAQDIEHKLALKSAEYRRYEKSINITAKDVQDSLKENEAAIEFTSFRYYGRNGWTDSTLYAAIILTKKDTTPHWVFLFEEKELKKLIDNNAAPNILYSNSKMLPYIQGLKGDKLYNLVWKKAEPYLKGINTIYYSPSGILNTVALAAIPYSGTAMPLCKKYKLLQMSSTKNIAVPPQEVLVTSIALMGGIVYDADSTDFANQFADTSQMHNNIYTNTILSNTKSRGADDYFTLLTATLPEVKTIANTSETADLKVSVFTSNAATEEAFKKFSGNAPSVLHLATHGFYRSYKKPGKEDLQSTETNFSLIEDPMFRSGIALAGANLKWHKNIDVPNRDDGIVTAYEVAQMDLSKTELVVLSACKSGLGDIDGSEGVFGLQRGFKSAGVNKMIISLWNVPDKASMEFMTAFYTKWLKEKKDIRSAFYETQLIMYNKYPNAPQNWAGFVLIE